MSKYKLRGAYHYDEFKKDTPYRKHVLDLVEKISEVVPFGSTLFEVGAGEGLILRKLDEKGYVVEGCDTDRHAVALAYDKGNKVMHGQIDDFTEDGDEYGAVLMCDVLEHVNDPISTIMIAKKIAPILVIAIPDRKDRHAQHEVTPEDIESYVGTGYKLVHRSQRHARHLMIYVRPTDDEREPLTDHTGIDV